MSEQEKIKELRSQTGMSQSEFASEFHIPLRTLQSWEQGVRVPTEYTLYMMERLISGKPDQWKGATHET